MQFPYAHLSPWLRRLERPPYILYVPVPEASIPRSFHAHRVDTLHARHRRHYFCTIISAARALSSPPSSIVNALVRIPSTSSMAFSSYTHRKTRGRPARTVPIVCGYTWVYRVHECNGLRRRRITAGQRIADA